MIITAHGYYCDALTPQGAVLTDGVNTYAVPFDLPAGLYVEHADSDLTEYRLTTPLVLISGETNNYG